MVRLTAETDKTDIGERTITVRTSADEETAAVTVERPGVGVLVVTDVDVLASVTDGDPINVTALVENTGDEETTQNVALFIDGQLVREKVTRVAGEATVTIIGTQLRTPDTGGTALTSTDREAPSPCGQVVIGPPAPSAGHAARVFVGLGSVRSRL